MSAPAPSLLPAQLFDRELPDYDEAPVQLRGKLPSWLRGSLVRTAAALFREGAWRAEHLFDGLAALYAFDFRDDGSVLYRQRLLDSALRRRLREGRDDTPHFFTGMHRGALARLRAPLPHPNDNTNVNVVSIGGALVAMTETALQHEIDPGTLQTLGRVRYDDAHGGKLFTLAHPQLDHERRQVLNVAARFAPRPALVLLEYPMHARRRRVLAEVPLRHVPYIHSFGLTPRHAVVFAGPLLLEPWRLLWSERGYIRHFRHRPELGSSIYCIERTSGRVRRYRAPARFVFHVINTFERGGDLVHDVLAYDDPGVIETLSLDALRHAWPSFAARPLRIVLREGKDEAELSPLADQPFEFPTLHDARVGGRPYRAAFGVTGAPRGDGYAGAIIRLAPESGTVARFEEADYVFGEPLFLPNPDPQTDGDGVLLSVALHAREPRAALVVLDAESLTVRAWGELPRLVPLSFHGSFRTARA